MTRHDLKTALRQFQRHKLQHLIGAVGLSVGLLCFSLSTYYTCFLGGTDATFPKSNRLAILSLESLPDGSRGPRKTKGSSSDLARSLREKDFLSAEAYASVVNPLIRYYATEPEDQEKQLWELNCIEVDTYFHSLFTLQFCHGNWETAKENVNSLILSRSIASKIFGEQVNPVGEKLTLSSPRNPSSFITPLEEGIIYTVQAVMEDLPLNLSFSLFTPVDMLVVNDTEGWITHERRMFQSNVFTYVLLKNGFTITDLEKELATEKSFFRAFELDHSIHVESTRETARKQTFQSRRILLYIGTPLFLIGLLNFFYLLVTSYWSRVREYAIRRIIGSSLVQLFSLLWVETFLLLLGAGLFTLIGAELITPHLDLSLSKPMNLPIDSFQLGSQIVAYWFVLLIMSSLLCLFIVIIWKYWSNRKGLSLVIRQRKRYYLRNALLGIQFFICWIFLSGTLALFLQHRKVSTVLFGTLSPEEKKGIYHVDMDYYSLSAIEKEAFVAQVSSFSGVKDVTLTERDLTESVSIDISRDDLGLVTETPDVLLRVKAMCVDSCFFSLMNLNLLEGTIMQPGEFMVNESFRKKERVDPGDFYYFPEPHRISGIVQDYVSTVDPWNQELTLCVFMRRDYPDSIRHLYHPNHLYVKPYAGQEANVRAFLEQEFKKRIPNQSVVKISTLAEDIRTHWYLESKLRNIILFLSVTSILVTLLGVYSTLTFDTAYRQKEVALRKVNGASTKDVVLLFTRLYFYMLTLSALFAFPLLYLLFTNWTQSSYTISIPYNCLFWLLVYSILFSLISLTLFFKIRAISRVNPARILKNE